MSSESGHVSHRRLFCVVGFVGYAALFCCLERLFDLLDQQALYCCVVVGFGEQDFAIGTDDKVAGYYVKGLGVVHLEGAKSHILLWFSVVKL